MSSWYNKPVKVPEKEYVVMGLDGHRDPNFPNDWSKMVYSDRKDQLAFLLPYGTDKAYDKRKETAVTWAYGNYYRTQARPNVKLTEQVFDNKPISGFKLTFDIRNGYRGSPDAWRIWDPRGFVVEIRSDNLAQLIKHAPIEGGEIKCECVWGREGGRNVLLTSGTEEYKEAIRVTEAGKIAKVNPAKISISKVKLGSYVILDNGSQARYLGRYNKWERNNYQDSQNDEFWKSSYVHVFLRESMTEYSPERKILEIYTRRDVKIATIENENEILSAKDAEILLNDINSPKDYKNHYVVGTAKAFTLKNTKFSYYLEVFGTYGEYTKSVLKEGRQTNSGVFTFHDGNFGIVHYQNRYVRELNTPIHNVASKKIDDFYFHCVYDYDLWQKTNKLVVITPYDWKKSFYYGDKPHGLIENKDDDDPVYRIRIEMTTPEGNVFNKYFNDY